VRWLNGRLLFHSWTLARALLPADHHTRRRDRCFVDPARFVLATDDPELTRRCTVTVTSPEHPVLILAAYLSLRDQLRRIGEKVTEFNVGMKSHDRVHLVLFAPSRCPAALIESLGMIVIRAAA